jgi:PAS domain S-box-containing protein
MHRLLERQIKKTLGESALTDQRLLSFFDVIGQQYEQMDQERMLLENALELSSAELTSANEKIKAQSEATIKLQQSALDVAANMVMITDNEGVIEYVNQSFCRVTGYAKEEVIGKKPNILNSGRHNKEFYHHLWKGLRHKEIIDTQIVNRRKDGTLYDEEITITPLIDEKSGKITHFIAIKRDITERIKQEKELKDAIEKALEASRLKSEFLSTMSHEIRTPMNGIIGMTDIVLDTTLTYEQQEYMAILKESSLALLVIINDILDFSKIEAGKLEIDPIAMDVLDTVESSADLFAAKAREKNIALMTFVDPQIIQIVEGDKVRIRQILTNLIGNALKFTSYGEVSVKATLENKSDDGYSVKFEISDTGIGMSKEVVSKLFQSFSQADSSTTREYGGTGLGLAISKKLCNLMGGEIGVESEVAKGSTFWFTLPLPLSKATHIQQPVVQTTKLSGVKVLIVDDSRSAREVVKAYLRSWGATTVCAFDAMDAFGKLQQAYDEREPFDVAIIDLAMPGIDGFELASQIFGLPHISHTKCILFTAFDQRGIGQKALDLGFSAYLTKPIRHSSLLKAVIECCVTQESENNGPKKEKNLKYNGPKRNILLVEDNEINQRVAKSILEKMGYDIAVANNGQDALDIVSKNSFGIILMDCQMPIMDGFEATMKLRQLDGDAAMTPIIAMTANAFDGEREHCLAVGMDDYLSKPVDFDLFRQKLEYWYGKKSDKKLDVVEPTIVSFDEEIIDYERLMMIFGDKESIKAVLELSIESLGEGLNQLNVLTLKGDLIGCCTLLHGMKGEASNLGLTLMSKELEIAESYAKNHDLNHLLTHIVTLRQVYTLLIDHHRKSS